MQTSEPLTCGDNSCRLDKPVGMGTNGGCRCFDGLNTESRHRVLRYLNRLKNENEKLRSAFQSYGGKTIPQTRSQKE